MRRTIRRLKLAISRTGTARLRRPYARALDGAWIDASAVAAAYRPPTLAVEPRLRTPGSDKVRACPKRQTQVVVTGSMR